MNTPTITPNPPKIKAGDLPPLVMFFLFDREHNQASDYRCFLKLFEEIKNVGGIRCIVAKPLSPTANEELCFISADEDIVIYHEAPVPTFVT